MKLLQTLVLLAFLPSVGYSQEINSENETQVTKVTENELLTLVSSNDVSADITVHTIKLRGVVLETENSDLLPEETLTEQVESILTEFSNLEGV